MASVSIPSSPDPRSSPFSLQEFNDLVCSAFNLKPHPNTAADTLPLALPHPYNHSPIFSCFESDTDHGHHQLFSPLRTGSARVSTGTASHVPPAAAKSQLHAQPKPHRDRDQAHRARSPLSMLKHVRTRASALVLRPANLNVARLAVPDLIPADPRPSLSSQHTSTSSAFSFLSRPHTPEYARSRSRTKSLPVPHPASFLPLTDPGSTRVRPARAPGMESLLSFFDDSGYADASRAPAYSRPATPHRAPPALQVPLRIHARLPPLRKAKSYGAGLFRRRKPTGANVNVNENANVGVNIGLWDLEARGGSRCPSPFTCPRAPPPVPPLPAWQGRSEGEDEEEGELTVPAYVFERRGSAASGSTMSSAKSTASLSDRIASLLPLALPPSLRLRARMRPKTSLTIVSTHSSPGSGSSATDSTAGCSPITPTGFAFPASYAYTYSEHAHGQRGQGEQEQLEGVRTRAEDGVEEAAETWTVGRVLTPEEDPFAKAEVQVDGVKARGLDATPTPAKGRVSRCASRQDENAARRASAGTGAHLSLGEGPLPVPRPSFESPASAAPTFPSSCSIYDVPNDEAGAEATPLAHTWISSRFSTPSIISAYSATSSGSGSGSDSEGCAVDEDPTFVFGTRGTDENENEARRELAPSPPPKDTNRHTCNGIPSSQSSSPSAWRAELRASLPPSPTTRMASVRTVASEPAGRGARSVQRPGSPFPFMGGSPRRSASAGTAEGDDDGDEEYESALDDSFVLGRCAGEDEMRGWHDEEPSPTAEADPEDLTPRAPTSAGPYFCLPVAHAHTPKASVDSTATVTLARAHSAPTPKAVPPATGAEETEHTGEQAEWDPRTAASSPFYSARSSISSYRSL
ncbi:hypothetical protein AcV7_000225 [Taiwanofungus camphoratus]|nr:hypothetical protein AcV7_000225 [Antrodia cinnamomea]